MSVIPEYPWKDKDGIEHFDLIRHYSDSGKKIVQVNTNTPYDDAIDKYPTFNFYIESDEDIAEEEDDVDQ